MTRIDCIKELRQVEGWSINKIARELEHSWATVAKYADGNTDFDQRGKRKRKAHIIGDFQHIIDGWLEEDMRRPAKQRRTAKKIYDDLQPYGFTGSDRTVRHYVRKRKLEMQTAARRQAIRLEHPPGTAQADFGEFRAIHKGQEITCFHLILSFPYSNGQAAVVLPAENTVCFLHGLATIFESIGGVPKEIWFDNLPPAVSKVLQGPDRQLTKAFSSFRWTYRFKAVFCNPASGHEKGSVENKVGYIRRNFLTPVPIIEDFDTFTTELNEQLVQDMQRPHYTKKVPIAELWEEDRRHLLALPNSMPDIAQLHRYTVNKYGEVKVNDHVYHLPTANPGQKVLVKAYWDRLEVFNATGETLLHTCPRHYMRNAQTIDWAAELALFARRPRALEHAAYLKALPHEIKAYLFVTDLGERRRRIRTMIHVLQNYSLDVAIAAAASAVRHGRTDQASVVSFAAYAADTDAPPPIDEPWTPGEVAQWHANLGDYDRLVITHGSA